MIHWNRFRSGKRVQNPTETIRQERSRLLTEEHDFYIVEAYKSLRTNVMFSLTGESASKVILVTSSMQGEGKSTTSANLAISFAQYNKKTLLIDCDMRRPKLARLMDLRSKIGLSNVLLQPELCEEALLDTKEPNLKVLLAGDVPPNPSELLGSARMQALLDDLRQKFDYIILDTPPVNVVTDAVVLCPQVDGALFVIRSGQSERGAVMRAVDRLEYAGAKLLGFVLGDVKESGHSYGNYGGHYAGHYAGDYAAARKGTER